MSDTLEAILELRDEIVRQKLAIKSLWSQWEKRQVFMSTQPTASEMSAVNSQAEAMTRDLHRLEDSLSNHLLRYHDETGDSTIPLEDGVEQRIIIRAELGGVIHLEP